MVGDVPVQIGLVHTVDRDQEHVLDLSVVGSDGAGGRRRQRRRNRQGGDSCYREFRSRVQCSLPSPESISGERMSLVQTVPYHQVTRICRIRERQWTMRRSRRTNSVIGEKSTPLSAFQPGEWYLADP